MKITAKEIIQELNKALKQFGTYAYYDRGPHEVMDVKSIFNRLYELNADEIINILHELDKHKDGELLSEAICGYIADLPQDEKSTKIINMPIN